MSDAGTLSVWRSRSVWRGRRARTLAGDGFADQVREDERTATASGSAPS